MSLKHVFPAIEDVIARYDEPHRAYHNRKHLNHCLEVWDEYTSEEGTWMPDTLKDKGKIALIFHDAVFDVKSAVNEYDSAELAEEKLKDLISFDDLQVIKAGILATRHEYSGECSAITGFQKMMADVDLAILGEHPDIFKDYENNVRTEYDYIRRATYMAKRSSIMQRICQHGVYHLDWFKDRFLKQAKINLEEYWPAELKREPEIKA